jgi:hypothetical protein
MKSFMICTSYHYSGHHIKDNKMGGACGKYRQRTNAYRVLVGQPQRKIPLEDLGVDGRITLNKS